MAKIYERSLSTIIAQGTFRDSFDPLSQTLSGEESTWKGDRLEIPCVIECFFFITRLTCFGCFTLDVLFHQASLNFPCAMNVGREVSRCCGCPLCCSFRVGASHRDNLMHLPPLDRNLQEK